MLRVTSWIVSPVLASAGFWLVFCACLDAPLDREAPQPRVIASWDPTECGDPHRVAFELVDDSGAQLSASAPCALGGLELDVPHVGAYTARISAWSLGDGGSGAGRAPTATTTVELTIDAELVRWHLAMPP